VAFGRLSDVFATGSADGRVRVWDLNDYSVLQSSRGPGGVSVNAVAMDDEFDGSIISAWSDGALRSFVGGSGDLAWHLPAHRGSANSVTLTPLAIISGGDDGRVAVWNRHAREQVAVFHDHTKPVLQVLADIVNPSLLHSVGADRCVFTFDLKTERRVTCHQLPSSSAASMTAISQRVDSEQEVVLGC
jgi:WD40 repeat protein